MNSQYPLGLPKGSVRALLALTVIAVWAALEIITTGHAPDAVRALVPLVAGAYGLMRKVAPEA